MGDYNRYIPSDRQIEGVQYLISYGIARKFIANDYKLIALNQVNGSFTQKFGIQLISL